MPCGPNVPGSEEPFTCGRGSADASYGPGTDIEQPMTTPTPLNARDFPIQDLSFHDVLGSMPGVAYVEAEGPTGMTAYMSPRIEALTGYAAGALHRVSRVLVLPRPSGGSRTGGALRRGGGCGGGPVSRGVPPGRRGRTRDLGPGRSRAHRRVRRETGALDRPDRRHHQGEGGGGTGRRGRAPLPDPGRAAPDRHVHRRARREPREPLREPTGQRPPRGDLRVRRARNGRSASIRTIASALTARPSKAFDPAIRSRSSTAWCGTTDG